MAENRTAKSGTVTDAPTIGRKSLATQRRPAIDRPKLIDIFERATDCSLIVLQDIAGSGKSTIVRQWAQKCVSNGETVCWLSLETDDNDISTFLVHLAESLKFGGLPVSEETTVLQASSPVSPYRVILTSFLNTISASSQKVTMVLDDLHIVTGRSVINALEWIADHIPPNLQMILTTRETPAWKLSRLRSQGLVFDFPVSELPFSATEMKTFLTSELGPGAVSPRQLNEISFTTKGWPVALQFFVLAAKQSLDKNSIRFVGASRSGLYEFFKDEIISNLTPEHQEFLISCSVLQNLSEDGCNWILERDDSASILGWLADQNYIFGDLANGFQYCHPLFREFLSAQLQYKTAKHQDILHFKAFEFLKQCGDFTGAIDHAILAGQFNKAALVIEQEGMALIQDGKILDLKAWLDRVPENLIEQHPRLELYRIWILFHTPYPREAMSRMAGLLRGIKKNEVRADSFGISHEDFDAEVRVLSAGVLSTAGKSALARQVSLASLNKLRDRSGFKKGTLCNILSYCEAVLGEVVAVKAASRLGIQNHKRANSVFGVIYSELLTAYAEYESGEPFKAEHNIRLGQDFARQTLGKGSYAEALLSTAQAMIKYDWNQLESAVALLETGYPIIEQSGTVLFVLLGALHRAKLLAAQGHPSEAIDILDNLRTAEGKPFPWTIRHCITDEKIRILLKSGDINSARVAIRSAGIDPNSILRPVSTPLSLGKISEALAVARIYIFEGRISLALAILRELEADAEKRARCRSLLVIRSLIAIAHWNSGLQSEAAEVMLTALDHAAPERMSRVFLDLGADAIPLLEYVGKSSIIFSTNPAISNFCIYLVRQIKVEMGVATLRASSMSTLAANEDVGDTEIALLEPLTERETDIAKLLADGMSNSQISQSLNVSTETIKWHLKNLYQKLGVSSRTQAVIALSGQRSFLDTDAAP